MRILLVSDGADGKSLTCRMSDAQIKARQDFAIEQNITTLRNRVNQLGVAEPLVQRQGVDRIVVQLPGVQDPNEINEILTATATLEFRLVDQSGTEPGSRRYQGRPGEQSQVLKRKVIASGDQIVDAAAGFSEGRQSSRSRSILRVARACCRRRWRTSANRCRRCSSKRARGGQARR